MSKSKKYQRKKIIKLRCKRLRNWITAIGTEFYSIFFYNLITNHYGSEKPFNYHNLNPMQLSKKNAAKPAILFLHGQSHNQSGILPLARKLHQSTDHPVFTLNLNYNEQNRTQHENLLAERIEAIKNLYLQAGQADLPLILIGHSRGGIEALNYLCFHQHDPKVKIAGVITIAARMTDVSSKWRGCPNNLKKLINLMMQVRHRHEHLFYHIVSNKDWLLPLEASIFNQNPGHVHIVENRSHMGILYANETHAKVMEFINCIG